MTSFNCIQIAIKTLASMVKHSSESFQAKVENFEPHQDAATLFGQAHHGQMNQRFFFHDTQKYLCTF